MTEQTKIDIIEGFRKKYPDLDLGVLIKSLENNPYKYLSLCDETQQHIIDARNKLKAEYKDIEDRIENLYGLLDIVPDEVDRAIDRLTKRLNEITLGF